MTEEQRRRIEDVLSKLQKGHQYKLSIDEDHEVLVMLTDSVGVHSQRSRFLVVCVTCEALLHEATTGPIEHMERHVHGHHTIDQWKKETR